MESYDPKPVIDICLECKRYNCPGICDKVETKKYDVSYSRTGVKKGTNIEDVKSRWDSGMSINKISQDMKLSRAAVRYWLRKAGCM